MKMPKKQIELITDYIDTDETCPDGTRYLLRVVIDRLQVYQEGQFACEANLTALQKCQEALEALKIRIKERIEHERSVEGQTIA